MENTEKRQEEMIIREGALELCIDHDHITIPVTRFQKLVEAEVKLGIVDQIYKTVEPYSLRDRLSFLFGLLPEKSDDNA